MEQMSVTSIMNSMIPISRFNKGEANKIFDEVDKTGTKIVVKNNQPACVLLSPHRYEFLMELLSDFILEEEAGLRMAAYDKSDSMTHEQVMAKYGISREDLNDIDVAID